MFTYQSVRSDIEKIIREHPDNVNPEGVGGVCLYTAEDDTSRHCIIGQWIAANNGPVPASYIETNIRYIFIGDEPDADDAFDWFNENVADRETAEQIISFLSRLQAVADGDISSGGDGDPIPWGEIDLDTV